MTPEMIAALSSGRATATVFFRFDLPDASRFMMFGSGEIEWDAHLYVGHDDTFGRLDSTEDVTENADGSAPNTSVTIIPAALADKSVIANPNIQLSPTKMWLAAIELDINRHASVVPSPYLLFDGFIDQATINLDRNRDDIDYSLISAFDYFFEDSEGQRLNGAFHTMVWSGELGLNNVTGIRQKIYWGANAPPGANRGSGSIVGRGQGAVIGGVLHRVFGGGAA
jgi:hypothetical protein